MVLRTRWAALAVAASLLVACSQSGTAAAGLLLPFVVPSSPAAWVARLATIRPRVQAVPTSGPADSPQQEADAAEPDLTIWQYWWSFNHAPCLDLRSRLLSRRLGAGTPECAAPDEERDLPPRLEPVTPAQIREQVVPALVHVLEARESSDRDSADLVTASLISLARIGDPGGLPARAPSPTLARIRPFLASDVAEIRETATLALGILASPQAIEVLEALLLDDQAALEAHGVELGRPVSVRVRAFAAYSLGLIASAPGTDAAVRARIAPILMRTLRGEPVGSEASDVAVACTIALGLAPLAWDGSPSRADEVGLLSGRLDDADAHPFVRAQAVTALARLVADRSGPAQLHARVLARLLALLKASDETPVSVRQSCILALGQLADADADELDVAAREALTRESVRRGDRQARRFALIALAHGCARRGEGAGPPTEAELRSSGDARGHLMELLRGGTAEDRSWAALALAELERGLEDQGQTPSEDARRALEETLRRADEPSQVGAVALALGRIRDREAAPLLRERFEKIYDPEVRGHLAIALGLMGDREAGPMLHRTVVRSRYQADLLHTVATGLVLLGDAGVVTELRDMLSTAQNLSTQAAIARALGWTGDTRAVEPLLALMQDEQKTMRARGFAAWALGPSCDKEGVQWVVRLGVGLNYRAAPPTLASASEGTGILDLW